MYRGRENGIYLSIIFLATSTRYWETYWKARNVKIAGYALLAQVEMDRLEYAGPIVIWLTKQRSYGGGFVSTKVSANVIILTTVYLFLLAMLPLKLKEPAKNFSKVMDFQFRNGLIIWSKWLQLHVVSCRITVPLSKTNCEIVFSYSLFK